MKEKVPELTFEPKVPDSTESHRADSAIFSEVSFWFSIGIGGIGIITTLISILKSVKKGIDVKITIGNDQIELSRVEEKEAEDGLIDF